ncbi:uncharacterized protein LOC131598275 [Vicia villosa]|uniref:uncharacterized protein LOC131598275 n=1 Tax=Vicia villosa TaxID=3911 RepID=UPI00273BE08F|nr:uncharacterized protein LOC131598275 [Vicia villosa]
MNGTNGIPNSLPTLDGKNWIRWKKQMQSLFGFHETLEVVTTGVPVLAADATEAQKTAHNEVKKKYSKAAYCIQTAVDSGNFDRISHAELAKEAWDILVKYHEGGEKVKVVKLQTLHRQYDLLLMGEDENVAEYVSKAQKPVHLMKGCGETLTDKMIVEKVMRTLTPHFDHVIVAIQESNKVEDLKLEDLVGSLEAHEIRIVEKKGAHNSIQALQAQSWKKNGGSNKFKDKFDKNQGKKPWSNPHKQQDEDRTSESSNGGGGNYRKDKEDKKKDNGSIKGKDEGAKLTRQDSDDSEGGTVVMAAVVDNHVESKMWFLDSGCSNHMTGQKVWLADFDESKKSRVKLAGNILFQAEGTGNIFFQMSDEAKAMIKYVLYVPGMK